MDALNNIVFKDKKFSDILEENGDYVMLILGSGNYNFTENVTIEGVLFYNKTCWNTGCTIYDYSNGTCLFRVGITATYIVC